MNSCRGNSFLWYHTELDRKAGKIFIRISYQLMSVTS